jgi:hypothetical protein
MQSAIISKNDSYINQHLYITGEEEIKEGDWVYHYASNKLFKYDGRGLCVEVEKIIITTDQDLINDGVATLPQQETFGSKGTDAKDVEKEMFELEQQLDIPNYLRWYNRKPNEPRKTTSEKYKEYQDWLNEPPEISNEEIEKAAANHEPMVTRSPYVNACKWYKEQLKTKKD